MTRAAIKEARHRISYSNVRGDADSVFAQVQADGNWFPVKGIKVVGGIIWVTVNGGNFMAHEVKIVNDLPPATSPVIGAMKRGRSA